MDSAGLLFFLLFLAFIIAWLGLIIWTTTSVALSDKPRTEKLLWFIIILIAPIFIVAPVWYLWGIKNDMGIGTPEQPQQGTQQGYWVDNTGAQSVNNPPQQVNQEQGQAEHTNNPQPQPYNHPMDRPENNPYAG